jgi:hypothetical protein
MSRRQPLANCQGLRGLIVSTARAHELEAYFSRCLILYRLYSLNNERPCILEKYEVVEDHFGP